jgi:two-component sensor histidine kinase
MQISGNRRHHRIIEKIASLFARFFPTASIGTYLVVMTTVVTLPLVMFVGFLMLKLESDEREDMRRETVEDARAISRNVDRRLQEMATSLNLLSQFPELESGDLHAFYNRVEDSLYREGLYLIIATRDGQQRLNTRIPFGEPLNLVPPQADLVKALETDRVAVSNLFFGSTSKEWVFNVTLPLPKSLSSAGDALIMTQNARDLGPLISADTLPKGWAVAILDGADRVIASSKPDIVMPGHAFEPQGLVGRMNAFSGSFLDDANASGEIYAYSQMPGWSWKAVVWGPVASSQAALVSTWRHMMGGSLVLVLIAVTGAYLVGRQMRSSIREISKMAEQMGKGDIVSPVDTKITEANQVAIALSNASFDRSQAEDRTQLMLHELVHRSKNILTLVQAMMRQLARENTSVADFQKEVDHRLRGLGMSIRTLAEVQWQGLPMIKLIETHLEVFGSVATQVHLTGKDFMLSPEAAQNLGLIVHELSTNSIKYGALSTSNGIVSMEWQQIEDSDRTMLQICWEEENGPPAAPPARKGFGTTIIKRHAEAAFSAQVEMEYGAAGFKWTLLAPLRHFNIAKTGPVTES